MAVTVLSGPERRRRWTGAEKLRIVEETLAPEAKIAEVARRHDVHPNLLHCWRRQAQQGVLTGGLASGFAAVAIAPQCPGSAATALSTTVGVIEIDFAAGERMRITGAVESSMVVALVRSLANKKRRR
jgi:transposase